MFSSTYWTSGLRRRNFGDAWLELIGRRLFPGSTAHDLGYDVVIGGGSLLSDYWLGRLRDDLLAAGEFPIGRALILGPGMPREDALFTLVPAIGSAGVVDLLWCRGPLTASRLAELNVDVPALGDTAYLWPLLQRSQPTKLIGIDELVVPHAIRELEGLRNGSLGHSDKSLVWVNGLDVEATISAVSSATRVLTGSLHVAICAHIYGTPFALVKQLIPRAESNFKYEDWFAALGIPFFLAESPEDARDWISSTAIPDRSDARAEEMLRLIRDLRLTRL